jgi:hypothetical protein
MAWVRPLTSLLEHPRRAGLRPENHCCKPRVAVGELDGFDATHVGSMGLRPEPQKLGRPRNLQTISKSGERGWPVRGRNNHSSGAYKELSRTHIIDQLTRWHGSGTTLTFADSNNFEFAVNLSRFIEKVHFANTYVHQLPSPGSQSFMTSFMLLNGRSSTDTHIEALMGVGSYAVTRSRLILSKNRASNSFVRDASFSHACDILTAANVLPTFTKCEAFPWQAPFTHSVVDAGLTGGTN